MENILILIIFIFIVFFFYNKNLQIKQQQNAYIETKQKCMHLCDDIDYILNDTIRYLKDKTILISSLKFSQESDIFELENFIDEEIKTIKLHSNSNKEFSKKIEILEPAQVDKSNIPMLENKKDYYMQTKESIISHCEEQLEEMVMYNE